MRHSYKTCIWIWFECSCVYIYILYIIYIIYIYIYYIIIYIYINILIVNIQTNQIHALYARQNNVELTILGFELLELIYDPSRAFDTVAW